MQVCNHFEGIAKGGGQNQKARSNRGRPAGETPASIIEHIESTAPESYLPGESIPQYKETPLLSQLACSICSLVLDKPGVWLHYLCWLLLQVDPLQCNIQCCMPLLLQSSAQQLCNQISTTTGPHTALGSSASL